MEDRFEVFGADNSIYKLIKDNEAMPNLLNVELSCVRLNQLYNAFKKALGDYYFYESDNIIMKYSKEEYIKKKLNYYMGVVENEK